MQVCVISCLLACVCPSALACMRCPPPAVKVGRFLDGCVQPLMTSRVFSAARDGGACPRHHFPSLFSVFISFSFICLHFVLLPPHCTVWRSLAAQSWTENRGKGDEKGGAKGGGSGRGRGGSRKGAARTPLDLNRRPRGGNGAPRRLQRRTRKNCNTAVAQCDVCLINGRWTFLFMVFLRVLLVVFAYSFIIFDYGRRRRKT